MIKAGVPVIPGSKEPVYDRRRRGEGSGERSVIRSSSRQHLVVAEKECVWHRHRTSLRQSFQTAQKEAADGIRR